MPTASNTRGGGKKAVAPFKALSLDEIEQATHLARKDVKIPEWGEGVGVVVQQLTKAQHLDVKQRATVRGQIDEDLATLHGIVESLVEPKLTHDQIGVIKSWPNSVVDRIEAAMLELNGLTSEALAAMEAAFRAAGLDSV